MDGDHLCLLGPLRSLACMQARHPALHLSCMQAVDNKEQKAKQREKEYERKRDSRRRERLMYHLRHAKVRMCAPPRQEVRPALCNQPIQEKTNPQTVCLLMSA